MGGGSATIKVRRWGRHKSEAKKNSGKSLFLEANEKEYELGQVKDAADLPEAGSIELVTFSSPTSNIAENFRSIRTTLLLSAADAKPRCFVVTSPLAQEGKTSTLSNLAVTFAQAGKRVLIIDADLRKPRLHKIFKIKNVNGLTSYLSAQTDLENLEKPTPIPNLFLINAGPVPPNPVELLGSERMGSLIDEMRKRFDYVLFDSPPVLPVSDAVVLGPRIDAAILVVWGGKTTREALKRAKEKLAMHRIKCAGAIINKVSLEDHDYYYMKHYYHYYGR
jgi:capsular exopolysaccharide synthesis family protein